MKWDRRSWVWVFLCSTAIFGAVPLVRSLQKFVYHSLGKVFFTYAVLAVITLSFSVLLYFFIFRFRVRKISQYLWLFFSAGLYIYFTLELKKYPEEAVHLLLYALLSYFVFRALSRRVRDWTVYPGVVFIVMFAGIVDEFIQWTVPGRYWGLNDIWINLAASMIFVITVSKGIRPEAVCGTADRSSLKILAVILTVNLLFSGLCLSNTPDMVKRYTSVFESLSWLRSEEPMTEFGHRHRDPEIGTFISRMTIEEIKSIDLQRGEAGGKALRSGSDIDGEITGLRSRYSPYTDSFMYEFVVHLIKRDEKLEDAENAKDPEKKKEFYSRAYAENLVLQKYFGNTLRHSGMGWSAEQAREMTEKASVWKEPHRIGMYKVTTITDLTTAWALILTFLAIVWGVVFFWKDRRP